MRTNLLEVAQEVIWMVGNSEFTLLMFKGVMEGGREEICERKAVALLGWLRWYTV
jgi:hypothetical protein